jgi:hypothetical protein
MWHKEENKMAKRLNNGGWFQLSLIGACLVISLLLVSEIQAGRITYVYDPLNCLIGAIYDQTTVTLHLLLGT